MQNRTRQSTVHRGVALALALAVSVAPIRNAYAQAVDTVAQDTSKKKAAGRLFTIRDAYIAAGFAVATIAAFPIDKRAAEELQDPNTQANRFFRNASTGFEVIASPGAYFIGAGLYTVGRIGKMGRVVDLGWHGTEAVLMGEAVTGILKGTLGRARPFVSNDTNPSDWRLVSGFGNGDRKSFPSGHSTTAFAAASAVTAEVTRWWPKSVWYVAPVMYGGATMVGLSRMYHNRHWASDVALGAAIGTFSGRKVVEYSHRHPSNRLDRWMLRTSVVPTTDGGFILAVSVP
jgi:membrane-associated phospholipid phosphatase